MKIILEIRKPELEVLIEALQKKGENLDDLLLLGLASIKAIPEEIPDLRRPAGRKSLAQIFAESPSRGLDISFERSHDNLRSVDL